MKCLDIDWLTTVEFYGYLPFMAEIKLTNGYVTLVDDEDVERLSKRRWRATLIGRKTKAPYASWATHRKIDGKRKQVMFYMHREIMDAPKGMDVDHINKNTLDNRKANLRVCSRSENLAGMRRTNATGYRGVSQGGPNSFAAKCGRGSIVTHHKTAEEAARSYDAMAIKKFGRFATLNFPIGAPTIGVSETEKD